MKNNFKEIPEFKESFITFEGEEENKPFVALVNPNIKKYSGKDTLPWFFGVSIALKDPDQNGLPKKEELKQLYHFEDKIKKIIKDILPCYFVGWSNWNSHRELMFYTVEPKELAEKLNKVINNKPEFKFAFKAYRDPKWKTVINAYNL